ncbi:Rv2578c family radical SAM protein [Lysobacter korlensis]|uniref:Rv2578c family radical SAM protein n=1 Tax=Lysobacter korlensis TaxID=553636 RepID=A0ABV6RY95_9GAMM
MRWEGQRLSAESSEALPGLAKLNNLVRSVRTPEFAGITFHEVLAKSALNHVPGASKALPYGWTINPYRGCSHACTYCVGAETMVLMGDGRQQPIWSVNVGDEIYGTRVEGAYRRYVKTKVLAHWQTRKRAYRITLADGTQLTASSNHRFLTDRGWKHVTGSLSGPDARPHLTADDKLVGFGSTGIPESSEPSYFVACVRVTGGQQMRQRFLRLTGPAITRKSSIEGMATKSTADLRVVSIEDLGEVVDMYDMTTGTGDFIANGVVAHNCFARPTHTYLDLDGGDDFDRQIIVKVNVADVLRKELAKPSWEHPPVALGTNTDPYQRAEGRYRLLPGIIAALADSGTPLSILTKGTLLRRDLPLLAEAAGHVPVDLAMSIAIYDDALQQSVEPGTPSTAARLATVTAVREHGLDCTVFLMPILPYLTDTKGHLDDALRRAKEAGASSVLYSALHLKSGVKQWFFAWLERERPDLVPKYRAMYSSGAYAPKEYRTWLAARIRPLVRAHGLERGRADPASGGVRSRALAKGAESLLQLELPAQVGPPTLF